MKFLLCFGSLNTYLKYGRLFPKYTFKPDREEVAGECSKFHYKRSHNLYLTKYYSGDHINKGEMGLACGT